MLDAVAPLPPLPPLVDDPGEFERQDTKRGGPAQAMRTFYAYFLKYSRRAFALPRTTKTLWYMAPLYHPWNNPVFSHLSGSSHWYRTGGPEFESCQTLSGYDLLLEPWVFRVEKDFLRGA